MHVIEVLKSILYGIVEGITEWLPVSSTGHLILLDEFLSLRVSDSPEFNAAFWEMFEVVIQLGAILAVVILFWHILWPFGKEKTREQKKGTWILWGKVLIASVPAALVGIVGDKILEKLSGKNLDGWLYNAFVVAVALVVYGVLFILVEKWRAGKPNRVETVDQLSFGTAFQIGIFQMLSMIPGTSRSGSTILGGMSLGLSRTCAAEFSFFMAIPAMAGASLVKVVGFAEYVTQADIGIPVIAWMVLLVGCAVSFGVSMMVIRFLMDFVRRHTFSAFGIYRIVLGILVLGYFLLVK